MKNIKFHVSMLLLLGMIACQKSPETYSDNFLSISSNADTLNLNLNQKAIITFSTASYSPSIEFDFKVVGGTIDGETSDTGFQPSGKSFTKEFIPTGAVGDAYITCTISNTTISKVIKIYKINPAPTDIVTTAFPATNLSINQAEQMAFELYLNPAFAQRSVTITFEGGEIHDANGPIPSSFEVNSIDGVWNGIILTDSSKTQGYYPLIVSIGNSSYTHQTNFWLYKEDISNVLTLNVTTVGPVLADELSTFNVEASINNHNAQEITFNSSSGKFSNGTSTITLPISGGTVNTNITTSQSVSTHTITAELVNPGYSESVTFTTSASLPETLDLVSSAWNIDSNAVNSSSAISFTAYLNRINGKVSTDLSVSAEAFQLLNGNKTNFGTFVSLPITSTSSETATTDFYGSTGMYPDSTLFVVFTTQGVSGVLSDTVSLNVFAP